MNHKKKRYYIGVDPSTHKSGIAVWDSRQQKFTHLLKDSAYKAIQTVVELAEGYSMDCLVRIEDARQRRWFGKGDTDAKRQGAGYAKAIAHVWEQAMLFHGLPYQMCHPLKGGTKWTQQKFTMITGVRTQTSEDVRDAACLVYGF